MKKNFLIICVLILIPFFIFGENYRCTFQYKVATTSGWGQCSEGTEPIVSIDCESNEITFPDFVFTDTKTIPGYTISGVEMKTKDDGSIEITKDKYEFSYEGKTIIVKKVYGFVKGNQLELEVILKVGKMPFNLKVTYYTE